MFSEADQRQLEQIGVFLNVFNQAFLAQAHVFQTQFRVAFARGVEEVLQAFFLLNEAIQFSLGDGSVEQIDKVNKNTAFLEKSLCLAGNRGFLEAKNLNVHGLSRIRHNGWVRVPLLIFMVSMLAQPVQDSNRDGYPDVAQLHSSSERQNFLRWFAAIAESQYTAPNADWVQRDCSGLLRYAYMEALKPKTPSWWKKFKYFPDQNIPPLSLNLPLPVLGDQVFRITGGAFAKEDIAKKYFAKEASAGYLMRHATIFLGKDPKKAQRGDLLFFLHPLAEGPAYHSMVYLGNGRVVYHTGASVESGGQVRLLSLQALGRHPDPSWHPNVNNPRFLGFFRWKMVAD